MKKKILTGLMDAFLMILENLQSLEVGKEGGGEEGQGRERRRVGDERTEGTGGKEAGRREGEKRERDIPVFF
jgi:hypothetical protein